MHVMATSAAECTPKAVLCLTTSDLAHVLLTPGCHAKEMGGLSSTLQESKGQNSLLIRQTCPEGQKESCSAFAERDAVGDL